MMDQVGWPMQQDAPLHPENTQKKQHLHKILLFENRRDQDGTFHQKSKKLN